MKTKYMFPILVGLLFAVMTGSANAQVTFTDDFNRADSSTLGSNYTYYNNLAVSSSAYAISSDTAISTSSSAAHALAVVDSSEFTVQDGASFALDVDLQSDSTGANWAGFVYNFQDASNFTYARWKSSTGQLQVISIVNGSNATYNTVTDTDFLTTATVHFALSGDGEGNYTITLSRSGVDDLVFEWTDTTYTGGDVGLYYTGSGTGTNEWTFDNLSASSIPEGKSTSILLGVGAIMAMLFMRRRR